jgi:NAD-dependent SIR2 family protein deacetylase
MILAKPNAAHSAIAEFLAKRPSTKIVTTNYEGCVDEALLGIGCSLQGIAATKVLGQEMDIPLLKMHGSINWSYCDACQDVRDFSLIDLKRNFENDTLSYAVIGICKTCGGQRRPLLVPPLSLKFMMFPNLVGLWNTARRCIEAAKTIIVVGYSFSEADTYITKMISRSLALNSQQSIVVCDTNPGLVPTLRERLSAHIDGVDEARVIQVVGSCETTLPDVLSSLLGERTSKAIQGDGTDIAAEVVEREST